MRPIKFRAWDKERKEMIEVKTVYFNNPNGMYINSLLAKNMVLIQYTGRLSDTRKEIWDGDILNVIDENIEYKDDYFGVVKMIDGCWMIDKNGNSEKHEMDYLFDESLEIHVSGNIYEDKHLLEVQT